MLGLDLLGNRPLADGPVIPAPVLRSVAAIGTGVVASSTVLGAHKTTAAAISTSLVQDRALKQDRVLATSLGAATHTSTRRATTVGIGGARADMTVFTGKLYLGMRRHGQPGVPGDRSAGAGSGGGLRRPADDIGFPLRRSDDT